MKIGLDTTIINSHGGPGRYTNEILRFLCTMYPEHQFLAIGPEPEQSHDYQNLTHIPFPGSAGLLARFNYTLKIAPILRKHSVDIYHNFANFGIYNAHCPVVTTVHDLLTLKYPELRSRRIYGWLYKYYVPSLIRKADRIVVVSESTKKDLGELYELQDNVTTVYLGYNKDLFSPETSNDDNVMKIYGLRPGYLLFVGYLIPNKNLDIVIRALHILRKKGNFDTKLVLVGERWYGSDHIFHLIESLSLTEYVIEVGYVPDEYLGAFYRQARLLLFPSIYEGFGLPILEAMACGTPVMASNAGSLPELIENERYTCSHESAAEWAEKILELVEDETAYKEARKWGLYQSQKFSWEKCAEEYMKIYTSLVDEAAHGR